MSAETRNPQCRAVGLRSAELWAIVLMLFFAGMAAGFAIGQFAEQSRTETRIESMKSAISALCLEQAGTAIKQSTAAIQEIIKGQSCHESSPDRPNP